MAKYVGTGSLTSKQTLFVVTPFTTWTTRNLTRTFDGRYTRQSFSRKVESELGEVHIRNLDIRDPKP